MKRNAFILILLTAIFAVTLVSCMQHILNFATQGLQDTVQAAEQVQRGDSYLASFKRFMELARTNPGAGDRVGSERDIDRAIEAYEAALKLQPSDREIQASLANAKNIKQQWMAEGKPGTAEWQATQMVAQVQAVQVQRQQEQARGYIELYSDITGTVRLNGQQTAYSVTAGQIVTITVENANGSYEVAVQDNSGTIRQAINRVSLYAGRQVEATVPNTAPNSPDDFDFIQNAEGGLTITKYKGARRTVVVPETISGIRVTSIGEGAFKEAFIRSYRDDRFEDNPLVSVVIPQSLVGRFPYNVINNPQTLTSITLPANMLVLTEFGMTENLSTNFGTSFNNFYISQGRKARTYVFQNRVWTLK